MDTGPVAPPTNQAVSPPVERLLTGLWQQREELGLIADELLAIFRSHGLTPPQDTEKHA
ncbi:MAG: hypothetical protein PHR30_05350 [Gallionellaceae bacterium]|nr:hypothetical protein [Gallionellaceae bacterium]